LSWTFRSLFNSLLLPAGVSVDEVLRAQQAADGGTLDIDPSDLAVRFPVIPGITYTDRPTAKVRKLRWRTDMARQAKEEEKAGEDGEDERYEMRSTLSVADRVA